MSKSIPRTSLFTIPKPFVGHIGKIQRNAISSWVTSNPQGEVIIFGDETGSAEVAQSLGIRHIPLVEVNKFGTPLLSDVFVAAARESAGDLLCYVNTDILLLPNFFEASARMKSSRFLGIGQRWDLNIDRSIDFSDRSWAAWLSQLAHTRGRIHPPGGSDFFLYPRGLFDGLPPFAVGRPGWDNWLIYHARSGGVPVVDMTRVVTVVHQNHDYAHIQASASGGLDYEGEEAEQNRALLGGLEKTFVLHDATRVLTPRGLVPAVFRPYLERRWATLPVLHPRTTPIVRLMIRTRRAFAGLISVLRMGRAGDEG